MPGTVLPTCFWRRIQGRSVGVFPTRLVSFQDERISDLHVSLDQGSLFLRWKQCDASADTRVGHSPEGGP